MDKQKKIFLIGGLAEGAILIFDLVISIIVWTTIATEEEIRASGGNYEQLNLTRNGPFIAFFQNNPTAFFCIICIPLFLIIALDFVYFAILASKKQSSLSEEQIEAIREKAKREVQAEMFKELNGESEETK